MKKAIFTILISALLLPAFSQESKVAVYRHVQGDRTKIIELRTMVGYTSIIEFPKGERISELVEGDSVTYLAATSGDRTVTVRPLEPGARTSLMIHTSGDEVFVFDCKEDAASQYIHGRVVIDYTVTEFLKRKPSIDAAMNFIQTDVKKSTIEEDLIKRLNLEYKVKKNHYNVEKVFDDGVFTFIYLPKTQSKPVPFLAMPDGKLEIIKYEEKNGLLIVHHVITGDEQIALKIDDKISFIKKS
jgi:type IV secretory pathway VirB9-like protein